MYLCSEVPTSLLRRFSQESPNPNLDSARDFSLSLFLVCYLLKFKIYGCKTNTDGNISKTYVLVWGCIQPLILMNVYAITTFFNRT